MRIFLLIFVGLALQLGAEEALFEERYRPRYHFTAEEGYINDPNGLFYLNGTYHLFYQHDGIREKVWGHATSTDLLHWEHHKDAITMEGGHPVFSGSTAIDVENTTGFGTKEQPAVVAVFTEWGRGQSLAYSTDEGKTWSRYEGNPVLTQPNDGKRSFGLSARDPHIMWDAERKQWVMVLFHNPEGKKTSKSDGSHRTGFAIFTSPDMKEWTHRSHVDGFYVCPDVMQLPTPDGGKQWLAMDWELYALGDFNGVSFQPAHELKLLDQGANLSANQSWKYLPSGRTIQIAWIRDGKYPGMPFTQQLSFPVDLSLREVGGELVLCKYPIPELEQLFEPAVAVEERGESAAHVPLKTQSYVFRADCSIEGDETVELSVLGKDIVLGSDTIMALGKTGEIGEPLRNVTILADITSIEIFANDGVMTMTYHLLPPDEPQGVSIVRMGDAEVSNVRANPVRSIWEKASE